MKFSLLIVINIVTAFSCFAQTWQHYTNQNSILESNDVRALHVDKNGLLWIGTWHEKKSNDGFSNPIANSLFTFKTSFQKVNIPTEGKANAIQSISSDKYNQIWVGTIFSVKRFDGNTWTTYNTKNSKLTGSNFSKIVIDRNGKVFSNSIDAGLNVYDGVWKNYNKTNSKIQGSNVTGIAIDSLNQVWLGTDYGIVKNSGTAWTVLNTGLGNDKMVKDVSIDKVGTIWCSTSDGLYKFTDGIWNQVYKNNVEIIKTTYNGDLWIGCLDVLGGIEIARLKGGKWEKFLLPNTSDKMFASIYSIVINNNNEVWVGTSLGLYRLTL